MIVLSAQCPRHRIQRPGPVSTTPSTSFPYPPTQSYARVLIFAFSCRCARSVQPHDAAASLPCRRTGEVVNLPLTRPWGKRGNIASNSVEMLDTFPLSGMFVGEVPESGRSGTTGNRVYLRVPRVRIPPSPSVVIARSCAREAGKSVRSGRKQRYRNSPCAAG